MATSFRGLVQGLVKTGIGILGDLTEAVTYNVTVQSNYDPVSGTNNRVVSTYTFNAVAAKFRNDERDPSIDILKDLKLIVAEQDLPVEPTLDDFCSLMGKNFTVQKTLTPPGNGVWLIHLRED